MNGWSYFESGHSLRREWMAYNFDVVDEEEVMKLKDKNFIHLRSIELNDFNRINYLFL
jgi:hypothetical protein